MSENNNQRLKVGITIGDTNGIGIEVAIKAVATPEMMDLCIPVIYGSSKVVSYHRNACNVPGFQLNHTKSADRIKENMPNLVECIDQEIKVELGHPSKQAGTAAFLANRSYRRACYGTNQQRQHPERTIPFPWAY